MRQPKAILFVLLSMLTRPARLAAALPQRAKTTLSLLLAFLGFWAARPLLLAAVMAVGVASITFGSMQSLSWMETESFCGRCHTMQPEVSAHALSPHETVECAECHVGEGLRGLVKAKMGGMRQMLSLALGEYAKPIPPAAHGMPPAAETCLRCHDPARQREDILISRSHFQPDENNTEQAVSVVVRLSDRPDRETAGVHWHVLSKVYYLAEDEEGSVIDWIRVDRADGTREEFIAKNVVEVSEQAGQRAAELRSLAPENIRIMDCYSCHNRVGHAFPKPGRLIDEAMDLEKIDPEIPFIKARSEEVLSREYATVEEAEQAVRELREAYHLYYPNLFLTDPEGTQKSFGTLVDLYKRTADPNMAVTAESYPSFLGHRDSAGCFRCHDGGHFKIVDGRMSNEAIPSACSTCHTFPSVGSRVSSVMLGAPPQTHSDRLWVFNHKDQAVSVDPTKASCAECHSKSYCSNCHTTGAKNVKHDNMIFNHAAVIRETGNNSCAYCHQKPFCDRCHEAAIEQR